MAITTEKNKLSFEVRPLGSIGRSAQMQGCVVPLPTPMGGENDTSPGSSESAAK